MVYCDSGLLIFAIFTCWLSLHCTARRGLEMRGVKTGIMEQAAAFITGYSLQGMI